MKTHQNSSFSLLRLCCLFLLGFGFLLASQSMVQAQTKSDIKADIQRALSKLPDAATTSKLSPSSRKLVDDTRALYQQGLQIESMTQSQVDAYSAQIQSNTATLQAVSNTSCVQTCVNEREDCILNRCGNNTSFPCFCCIPCNIIFDLCVFDCLVDIEIGVSIGTH